MVVAKALLTGAYEVSATCCARAAAPNTTYGNFESEETGRHLQQQDCCNAPSPLKSRSEYSVPEKERSPRVATSGARLGMSASADVQENFYARGLHGRRYRKRR